MLLVQPLTEGENTSIVNLGLDEGSGVQIATFDT